LDDYLKIISLCLIRPYLACLSVRLLELSSRLVGTLRHRGNSERRNLSESGISAFRTKNLIIYQLQVTSLGTIFHVFQIDEVLGIELLKDLLLSDLPQIL
jgi:hypothetical protein